jgi:hypothetical protein
MQVLICKRDELLEEIHEQEALEVADVGRLQIQIAAAEAEVRTQQAASREEQRTCQSLENRVSLLEAPSAASSAMKPWRDLLQGGGLENELAELREELASSRELSATLDAKRSNTNRERLDEWVTKIRENSQENQEMEAKQQMATAHLKAIEAMVASTASQMQTKEATLYSNVRQLEEDEALAAELATRAVTAETQLKSCRIHHIEREAQTNAFKHEWEAKSAEQEALVKEAEAEHACLTGEVDRLEREAEAALQAIMLSEGADGEGRLRIRLGELRLACEATASKAREASDRQPHLEADVHQMTQLLPDEHRMLAEHEETHAEIAEEHESSLSSHSFVLLKLETELQSRTGAKGSYDRLMAEEQSLKNEYESIQNRIRELESEKAVRNSKFETILLETRKSSILPHMQMGGSIDEAGIQMQQTEGAPTASGQRSSDMPYLWQDSSGAAPQSQFGVSGASQPPSPIFDPGLSPASPPVQAASSRRNSGASLVHGTAPWAAASANPEASKLSSASFPAAALQALLSAGTGARQGGQTLCRYHQRLAAALHLEAQAREEAAIAAQLTQPPTGQAGGTATPLLATHGFDNGSRPLGIGNNLQSAALRTQFAQSGILAMDASSADAQTEARKASFEQLRDVLRRSLDEVSQT